MCCVELCDGLGERRGVRFGGDDVDLEAQLVAQEIAGGRAYRGDARAGPLASLRRTGSGQREVFLEDGGAELGLGRRKVHDPPVQACAFSTTPTSSGTHGTHSHARADTAGAAPCP